jgi:CRP-like cAMP-binding protein
MEVFGKKSGKEGIMKDGELGRVYADGEPICKEGEEGDVMYVIQSGSVKITKDTSEGTIAIATLESGEIFGEMALFDRLPRSASASAYGETRVLSVDKKKLFSSISRDPTMVFKILESMSQRIRRLDEEHMRLKKNRIDIMRSCMDVDQTCQLILEEGKNIIQADNGSVMLLDEKDQELSISAAFGADSNAKVTLTVGEGIAGDVMKTGKAELVNNVSLDSRFVAGSLQIHSLMCIPLKCKGDVFGVINFSNNSEKLFTLDDLKLLHSLATYASVAIQNARSFSNLQHATDEILRHATLLDMS